MAEITVTLDALDSTDMGLVRRWRNDYAVWQWCRQSGPISDAEQIRWFNRQSEDPSIQMFKVVAKTPEASAAVGVCGLTSIDFQHGRAEFSLYIAPEAQSKGLGRLALALLLDHAFDNLGLNLVWGESFEGNPAMAMFVSLGFVREGVRRQFYWKGGKRVGAHLFSITQGEWCDRRSLASRSGSSPEPSRDGAGADGPGGDQADAPAEGTPARKRAQAKLRPVPKG
jgi:RimJ/RimL family protein N-acetyltransferase